jgi:tetratricopeptide (TPR) repeat protein
MSTGELLAKGQQQINQGQYEEAVRTFSSIIQTDPRTVDAYRGRSEAKLFLGRYSDAYRDLFALVISAVRPSDVDDLGKQILTSYDRRLGGQKPDVPALTGGSFARWVYWQYGDAIPLLDQLLKLDANNVYANLFRGSNRFFANKDVAAGRADLDRAIQLAPQNSSVRHIVADAYTYTPQADLQRALAEATTAARGGLDTPRIRAILATALNAQGDSAGAAAHIQKHLDLVTTENVQTGPLAVGSTVTLDLVPGRTFQIPLQATAGQAIKVATRSTVPSILDTILVVLGPDGSPVVGSDDAVKYFAALDWAPPATGTYQMRVTSFEAISTGPLVVTRS